MRLTAKTFGRRGFAQASLVADWSAIVGPELGRDTLPLKIVFPRGERSGGVLHLKVATGAAAIRLQHLERLVVERVNGHFGYGAVARLALTQGPVPRPFVPPVSPEPVLSSEQRLFLSERLAGVADPSLKEALARLGRHLAARR